MSDKKYWFEYRTRRRILGFGELIPKGGFGFFIFLVGGVGWIGGPYVLFEYSDQVGLLPGILIVIATVFLLLFSWIKKTEHIDHS